MRRNHRIALLLANMALVLFQGRESRAIEPLDLQDAIVVSPFYDLARPEGEAVKMLLDEIEKRTRLALEVSSAWPEERAAIRQSTTSDGQRPIILLTSVLRVTGWPRIYPVRSGEGLPELQPEGYRITIENRPGQSPIVWAVGADARGVLFAAGALLRTMEMRQLHLALDTPVDIATAPDYPLRGHQLGYRAKANTYDRWTPAVYEQHIRDLIVFGCNAVEQIPHEDPLPSPHMPIGRVEMTVAMSEICDRYGIEFWMWMPVMEHREEHAGAVALGDEQERRDILASWNKLFHDCKRIDGVFVPSSDPGMNRAERLMPFLERAAKGLRRSHPHAKLWASHQKFTGPDLDFIYGYLDEKEPDWFGGLVFGPWSRTTFSETRRRLPQRYGLRSYPDITHTVRCQFPVYHWDRAFAHTLGREPINPRPVAQKIIHNTFAPDTIGFITYSDGVHDDVNKIIWTALGWDVDADVRNVLTEYGRYFVRDDLGTAIADGLLALEQNWTGPLASNGAVDGTLRMWQELERQAPELAENNWRFLQGLFRAYYDAYTRHRLLYECSLEERANEILAEAGEYWDANSTMYRVERTLRLADTDPPRPGWRQHLILLADRMFALIGHQISVDRHAQSDYDRGTMLDTLDHPINNRRWLLAQFQHIRTLDSEQEKIDALHRLPLYESPVPGTIYDDLGDISRQERLVVTDGWTVNPRVRLALTPQSQGWEPYMDHRRLSQQDGVGIFPRWAPDWSMELRYVSLERDSRYRLRVASRKSEQSTYAVHADDIELKPMGPPDTLNEIQEYSIPKNLTADGSLNLQWTVREGVGIHVTETWLIPEY